MHAISLHLFNLLPFKRRRSELSPNHSTQRLQCFTFKYLLVDTALSPRRLSKLRVILPSPHKLINNIHIPLLSIILFSFVPRIVEIKVAYYQTRYFFWALVIQESEGLLHLGLSFVVAGCCGFEVGRGEDEFV